MFGQALQLFLLTLTHMTGDLLGGILSPVLPVLCERFSLSFSTGLALITLLGMTSNMVQVAGGHVKTRSNKPWVISIGLLLAALIPLIGIIPPGPYQLLWLAGVLILGGTGIAWIHPQGLRGVHELHQIPSSISTSLFMVGGFAGFSSGAWLAGSLVERLGLPGLLWLIPLALLMAAIMPFSGVRLTPGAQPASTAPHSPVPVFPFGALLLVGTLTSLSAVLLTSLLPTYLYKMGFPLSFGGRSVFFFGIGGALGSLFWGGVAHRKGYSFAFKVSLGTGIPLLVAYLVLSSHAAAIWLLMLSSFFLYAAYPLVVSLSRYARSRFDFGQRMGLIVGGSWGMAGLLVMGLGPVGERLGLAPLLHLAWISYLVIFIYSFLFLKSKPKQ
ncbi:MAG: hypothetical protein R6X19_00360 [Kiritimatiellia bacterium]